MDALEDSGFSHTVVTRTGTGATGAAAMPVPSTHARPWLRDPRSIAAVVAAVALGAFALFKPTPQPVPGVPTRARITEIDISRQWGGSRLAISPDGAWIVAGVVDAGTSHLHIRRADDPEWRRLANTENATNPVFSPDGQDVAFQRNADGIFRVPISGGPALPVAPGASFDPHWIGDDIVFMEGGQIRRIPATGGEAEVIFASDTVFAVRPHLLPNGKAVLFAEAVAGDPLASRVFLYEVETGELRVLAQSGNQPSYLPTGHVVFAHGSEALMAIPLDAETLEAGGAPMTLLPRLTVYNGGGAQYAVAQTGTLVYSATSGMGGSASRVLVEVDMEGTATTLPLVPAALQHPRYAPDGTKIAYEDGSEIRVYDVVTGASPQVTSGGGFYPEWAPSGAYIYFSSGGRAQADGTRRPSDLSEEAVSLFERPSGNYINDVAEGDSVLLVRENSTDRGMDLVIARLGPDSVVFEDYLTAEWNEWTPQISPDGRWVAYVSDEAGEARVFVHSFPTPTGQRAVSPGVGMHPVWSPDGDRIYYRDNERMWSVDVTYEPTFVVSAPTPLFEVGSFELNIASGRARAWDIHPDGDRFIFARARGVDGTQPGASDLLDEVYLVSNWFEEVRRLTGGSSR
jgi:Tol biopolymer transport system component